MDRDLNDRRLAGGERGLQRVEVDLGTRSRSARRQEAATPGDPARPSGSYISRAVLYIRTRVEHGVVPAVRRHHRPADGVRVWGLRMNHPVIRAGGR